MTDISTRFFATCGSVTGREHARLGRNNQDGVALAARDGLLVAVVTDGCSSGKWSEVGARLAARWLVEWTPHYLAPPRERVEREPSAISRQVSSAIWS